MAAVHFLLLLLPSVSLGSIRIQVTGDEVNPSFSLDGDEVDIISDWEKKSFELTDNNLKRGVEKSFGAWPTDAYVKSPTPWGDLYTYDGFYQVTRTLKPIRGRVIRIAATPAILKRQCFENNSKYNLTTNAEISQSVSRTVTTSFEQSHEVSLSHSIGLEVNLLFVKGSGKAKLGYSFAWGQTMSNSETEEVSATAGFSLVLPPHSSVLGTLEATRGSVTLEVEYEASLSGHVAVNYEDTYRGRHFWGVGINDVLSGANLPKTKIMKSTHDIGFYTNSKVFVTSPSEGDC